MANTTSNTPGDFSPPDRSSEQPATPLNLTEQAEFSQRRSEAGRGLAARSAFDHVNSDGLAVLYGGSQPKRLIAICRCQDSAGRAVSHVARSRWGRGKGRTWLALGLCTALLSGTAPLGAQSDDENARRHFESGAAYLQQSDYENALREFQAAYALSKRPPLLLNIANVYERMGKLQEAVDALSKYLEEDPKSPERTTHETRIANLKKRIEAMPRPSATASPAAPPVSSAPPPAPVATAPPAPLPPAPAPASAPNRTPAFIAFGVGGAAAIGAVVTGLVAKGKYDDADKSCKPGCTDDTVSSIKSMALVSDILSGVAIAGVGVGAILLLTSGGSQEAASGSKPSIAGGVGPHGGRLEATWRF